jgi:hypothetical protein
MDGEFLDDRVGQQLGGQLRGQSLALGGVIEFDLEALALTDRPDLRVAKPMTGTRDRLALGVVDLLLKHHVDNNLRHVTERTRTDHLT